MNKKVQTIVYLAVGLMLSIGLSACGTKEPPNCIDGYIVQDGKCVEEEPVCFAPSDYSQSLTYNMVFSDEFDGSELDTTKWNIAEGTGGGNNEIQLYTDDNHVVSEGFLTITATYEEDATAEYKSTRLNTRYKHDFKYGIFEMRAKIPSGVGTWPAFWMMPTYSNYGGWPDSGEIDIMEHVGYDENVIHGTVHTRIYNHKQGSQKGGSTYDYQDVTSAFHTYKIEWLPDRIIWSIDDVEYYTYNPGKYSSCPSFNVWPFNKDFYLIINLAVGGDWGGAQGVEPSDYPTEFVIDYVRVYQAEELENYEDGTE